MRRIYTRLQRWLVLATLLASAAPTSADTYPRQPGVDALHYVFRMTLRDDTDEITGETTAELAFLKDGLTEFELDLAGPADGKGMTVTGVTQTARQARYVHEKDRLRITLDPPAKSGERRQFTIIYHGVPRSGLRVGPNKRGERSFFSMNWPDRAHQWLPLIDHPYDKATSEFIVTAPARYQVVANGLLQEQVDLGDGQRRTHWKQSVPIASWLNALGVAQFASHYAGQVKGIPLQTWVYHQDREVGAGLFEGPARRAVEFFSEAIGPYPYEKVASIQAPSAFGGLEHASAIFYSEDSFSGRPVASLVAHEMAHQWFGDSVTEKDWDDVWLSEGFATYFALLYTEHYEGRDAFVAGLKRSRNAVLSTEKRRSNLGVVHENLGDTRLILNGLVYQKGAWTLHMLRGQIGTDKFWAGIRAYYQRYRDANACTDDLRHVMESVSDQDLSWFFRQWLCRPGSPKIEGTWRYDPQEKCITIDLAQTQQGEPYRLPLEFGIAQDGVATPRVVKAEMNQLKQRFDFPADKEPAIVDIDPNIWVLMQANFHKQ